MLVEVHFPAVLHADALSLFVGRRWGGVGGRGLRDDDGVGGVVLGWRAGRCLF